MYLQRVLYKCAIDCCFHYQWYTLGPACRWGHHSLWWRSAYLNGNRLYGYRNLVRCGHWGTALFVGTAYSPTVSVTTTFYASCTVGGCISTTRDPSVVTVNPPPAPPSVDDLTRCGTGLVTLLASGCVSGTVNWYEVATGGTILATGASYSPIVAATKTFYANCTLNGCVSNTREAATVTVVLATAPTITGANSVLPGDSITLSASGCTGSLTWSTGKTGTTLVVKQAGNFTVTCTTATVVMGLHHCPMWLPMAPRLPAA